MFDTYLFVIVTEDNYEEILDSFCTALIEDGNFFVQIWAVNDAVFEESQNQSERKVFETRTVELDKYTIDTLKTFEEDMPEEVQENQNQEAEEDKDFGDLLQDFNESINNAIGIRDDNELEEIERNNRKAAEEYYCNKYNLNGITVDYGKYIDGGLFNSYTFEYKMSDGNLVYYYELEERFFDNRQYDAIQNAMSAYYEEISGTKVKLEFSQKLYSGDENIKAFTMFFDGDVKNFIRNEKLNETKTKIALLCNERNCDEMLDCVQKHLLADDIKYKNWELIAIPESDYERIKDSDTISTYERFESRVINGRRVHVRH